MDASDMPETSQGTYVRSRMTGESERWEAFEKRRKARLNAALAARWGLLIISRGGNIHGVNRKATNKRRAQRKAARPFRKANRG